MAKQHLKILAAPKTWHLKRKEVKYVTRPKPGAHSYMYGLPLNVILRDILKIAETRKEVKRILETQEIRVDAKKIRDYRRIVGLMDTLSLPAMDGHYRILINNRGKLDVLKVDEKEANLKLCKIRCKKQIKGKIQLNLSDGRNLLVDKDAYKAGDTLLIELPGQLIKEHIKFEKGNIVYLIGGEHVGSIGVIENIGIDNITFKLKNAGSFETAKRYGFAVGTTKPALSVLEKISKADK